MGEKGKACKAMLAVLQPVFALLRLASVPSIVTSAHLHSFFFFLMIEMDPWALVMPGD